MSQIFTCTVVPGASNRAVAYLDGELDSHAAESMFTQLAPLVSSRRDVVVDLSGLRFVNTTGLVLLERLARCLADKGGSLCLAEPSAPVRRLLDITGLATRFTVRTREAFPPV
jgi:anti-anti-sigma factor